LQETNPRLLFIVNVDWFFLSHRLPIAIKAIDEGFDVTIACRVTKHGSELKSMGFNVVDIPFSRSGTSIFNELRTIFSIIRLFRDIEPSIIHAVTIKPVLYSGFTLKIIRRRIPFVAAVSGLGYVFSAKRTCAKLTKFLVSILYKIAFSQKLKTVIFQNTSDQEVLSRVTSLNQADKVVINGSGVDLRVYDYVQETFSNNVTVVMASRLLREKGVYEYIEAAKLVRKDFPNITFLLAGTPDLDNPHSVTQAEIDGWVRDGIVEYLGYRDDIPGIFSNSNIVCLPSFYGEGVPKVLIEGAACGRAIVTTDNPGCRDAILNGKTGLLVPIRNIQALYDAIVYLILNPIERCSMGKQARTYAESQFDVTSVVDKHIRIYKDLLERTKK